MYIDMSFFVQQHHLLPNAEALLNKYEKVEDQEEHDNLVGAFCGVGDASNRT
jgi:hypothetical protein